MPHPLTSRPQPACRVVHHATRPLVMPGANALTRELTAAILACHGLLDEHPPSAAPITAAARRKATACRMKAAALCDAVARLCARAITLQREAVQLCQPCL
jgi:hypothetical protein